MLAEALKRTLLLMRTDLQPEASDEELLEALTGTSIVLSAGDDVLGTHSGQCALITAALLMGRSGHQVYLDFPDSPLLGRQPPLIGERLLPALLDVGQDLLPGCRFEVGKPRRADLAVLVGDVPPAAADESIAIDATDWEARLSRHSHGRWSGDRWPIGAMAAAALAAGEAFKAAMRKLQRLAVNDLFLDWYGATDRAEIDLCPNAERSAGLGLFDMISGGAIANGALYPLLRLPDVSGSCRVLDDDVSALSNLNRNMLLRRSRLDRKKVEDLASYGDGMSIEGLPVRYGEGSTLPDLAGTVLVGVDDIPSRWQVQRAAPAWLGVGATDRFIVQVSSHVDGSPCAGCAYPYPNQPGIDIPTVAFVSFWSGLLLAVELLRHRAERDGQTRPEQRLFSTLRPESWVGSRLPLAFHASCPVRCGSGECHSCQAASTSKPCNIGEARPTFAP